MARSLAQRAAVADRLAWPAGSEVADHAENGTPMLQRPSYAVTKAASQGFDEIGTSGLRQFGGYVLEEWLTQIQGRRAAWVWREMMDNSPIVGAILFAIDWLSKGVEYRVEGKDARAEFVDSCMHDMSQSWPDFISEALSCLPYGWSYHEIVYKRRNGYQERPAQPDDIARTVGLPNDTSENDSNPASSEFKDGKIGWRKLPARAQETLLRWHFDGYSGVRAMEQIDWHGGDHVIPIEKALLFRSRPRRGNPEGYSMLRTAYVPYFMLKNIQQIEAIGIERDLAGLPVLTPPEGVDIFAPGNSALLQKAQQLVTGVKRDEDAGIILPTAGWNFELISSGGSRQIDTDEVVRRYEQRIATSMLADFILVGQDTVGSYAMVDIKTDLFGVALDGIIDSICEVFNRYAIPRLLKMNGMSVENPPRITHGSAGRIALEKVGTFLQSLALAGAPIPWSVELIRDLFLDAGLPTNFEEHEKPETLPVLPRPAAQTEPVGTGTDANEPGGTAVASPKGVQGSGTTAQAATQQVAKEDDPLVPLAKAQRTKTDHGTAIHVGPYLRQRAQVLSNQLDAEIQGALSELAENAATAYLNQVQKASAPNVRKIVQRVLAAMSIRGWIAHRLTPILRNHAARVTADTQRTLRTEIQLEVHIADEQAQVIAAKAGAHLRMADIDAQVRASITQAIEQSFAAGENPITTARKIRELVPAGRFVNAGSKYRSQLIARNETQVLQREATLAAYRSNPNIEAVQLQDGIYGPPRSDSACIARDGDVVPIAQADSVHPYHIACTLGFLPVVVGKLPAQRPNEPTLV